MTARIDCPNELTVPAGTSSVDVYIKGLVGASAGVTAGYSQVQFWNTRGITVRDIPEVGRSEILLDQVYLPLDGVDQWASLGSIIYDYDFYHEIQDVTALCPYSTSGETWETWGVVGDSHKPVQIGQYWYRSSRFGVQGERLVSTEWAQYISNPDTVNTSIVRLISVEEFAALSPPPGG